EGVLEQAGTRFSDGALGCAASHRKLWTAATKSNRPTLIMEDDCCLSGNFAAMAERVSHDVPGPWDILYFGYNTNAAITVSVLPNLPGTIRFHDRVKRSPGWFAGFSDADVANTAAHRVQQIWGLLCYMVSPAGADRLLTHCFPLSSNRQLYVISNDRQIAPYG